MAIIVFAAIVGAAATSPAATPTGSSPYTNYVFGDEFNGPAGSQPDPAKWRMKVGAPWNQGLNSYTARTENVAMDGAGSLDLIARHETYTGADGVTRDYTSGGVLTRDTFKFTYGHVEARMRVPSGRGFWSSFWTLRWPLGGEIDIFEHRSQNPTTDHTNIRSLRTDGGEYYSGGDFTTPSGSNPTQGFHIYGVTWEPGRISWQFDGQQIRTVTPADLRSDYRWNFGDPQWIIFNLGVGGNWSLSPNSTTPFPSRVKIDWVRVYQ